MFTIHVKARVSGVRDPRSTADAALMLPREALTAGELIALAITEQAYVLPEASDVQAAQRAFVQGVFTLIVDGEQVCKLDERLCLQPTSRVTFLRLMPLVGG